MSQPQSVATAAIGELVERYALAAGRGDSGTIASSFFEDAPVLGSLDGPIVDRSAAQFLAVIDESGPSPALETKIAWVDVAGTAAVVRVDGRDWHGVHYADFLSLIQRDGIGRIAGKTFVAHERA